VANLEQAVRKVLNLARTHPPEQVETSLHDILSESVDLLQSQLDAKGVRIETKLQAAEDQVLADPEELKNVFVNLLVNAEEAMPDGGTVRLATENTSGATSEGSIEAGSEKTIRVRITDDGPGVPEEFGEQIFRPFVTTKPDGTGFGLAVARLAVQEHHGRVYLESRGTGESEDGLAPSLSGGDSFSGGATFVVELPVAETSVKRTGGGGPETVSSSDNPQETGEEAS
jgi:signal transduction histidine kinase